MPDPIERTCVRTSSVKLRLDDPAVRADLNATADALSARTAALVDFLIACRGEAYWDGERGVAEVEVLERQTAYLKGMNPYRGRLMLRAFFDVAMNADHNVAISYMSPMYKSDSKIGLATRVSRKTGLINEVDDGKALCRTMLDAGILPIVPDDMPHRGFQLSAWIDAFTSIRAWHQADLAYRAATAALASRLADLEGQIAGWEPEARELAASFPAAMAADGRRLDHRLATRWRKIRRSLLSGRGVREGEPELFEPFRPLWEGRDQLRIVLEVEKLRHQLASRRSGARLPRRKDGGATILLSVSRTNTVPVRLSCQRGEVQASVPLLAADQPGEAREHFLNCLRSRYFENLEIETIARGATTVATLRYTKGNRDHVPVTAEVKEPRLRRKNGDWYLDLIQSVRVVPATPLNEDPREAFRQANYFLNPSSPVGAADVRVGLRALSVDLGINPALAFAVYELARGQANVDSIEVPGIGWANRRAVGIRGGTRDLEHHHAIATLRRRTEPLKSVIRFRGRILNGDDIASLHPRYLDSVLRSFGQLGIPYEADPVLLKRTLLDLLSQMRQSYDALKKSTVRRVGLMREQFEWAGAVRDWITVQKTWMYNGPNRANRPRHAIAAGDFARSYRYGVNLRRDVIRRVAAEVRRLAFEHRADIVLVEDLEYFSRSVAQEKGVNSLLALWSPQSILDWIKNALQPHGIAILRIDPRHTSRIDPCTGEFGFYDFAADKSALLVERDGRAEILDADIAAACNLQRRFWRRNDELYRLEAIPDDQGAVPTLGKQVSRYFQSQVGAATARITGDQLERLTPAHHRAALAAAQAEHDPEKYYRDHGRWIDRDSHIKRLEGIFERFATTVQASSSDRDRRYVQRVNSLRARELRAGTDPGGA